jgi:hypothetical protein
LYVFNKIDAITIEELDILDQMPNYVPISSQHEWNLEELMEEIWNRCNMLRIYTKPKGQMPDYDEPVILHAANPTIEEFCNRLHRSIMNDFAFAWVWGKSAKHQPVRILAWDEEKKEREPKLLSAVSPLLSHHYVCMMLFFSMFETATMWKGTYLTR